MIRRSFVLLSLAVFAVAAVGCGDDALSSSEYSEALADVMAPLGQSLQDFGTEATEATSTDDVVGALEGSAGAIDDAISEIGAIDGPSDVDDAEAQLVDLLEGYKGDVEAAVGAVEDNDLAAIGDFQTASSEFGSALNDLRSEFEDAGIDFGN